MTDNADDPWARRMRAGDFAAIPATLDFLSSAGLAMMIDGYGVVGDDPAICRAILDRALAANKATPEMSALDLWIALFFAHRACRHSGFLPEGEELQRHDALARRLRSALLALTPTQKVGIMAAMDGGSYWDMQNRHD